METTSTTTYPEPSPYELALQALSLEVMVEGPISEQFNVRTKEVYPNQDELDNIDLQISTAQSQLSNIQSRISQGSLGVGSNSEVMRLQNDIGNLTKKKEQLMKDNEPVTEYQLTRLPPAEVQATIDSLPGSQRRELNEILDEYGYESAEFEQYARRVEVDSTTHETLGSRISAVAQRTADTERQIGELKSTAIDRFDKLLKGELIDLPQETINTINKSIDATYEPYLEELGLSAERVRSQINEQGVAALNQVKTQRAQSEVRLAGLKDDELEKLKDLAASSGRSVLDPNLQRSYMETIGKEFTEAEVTYGQAERNIGDLIREQLLGVTKETEAGKQAIQAKKAAEKAAQQFALQTGIYQSTPSALAASQINEAANTQTISNQLATLGGVQSILAPLVQERLASPTTTTSQSPFSAFLGMLGGIGSIAGSVLGAV